uniref:Uncharacterized protein n=1 Tax=Glossina austeni TaxID=7395 RepID=A0A1A9URU8_GLOAU
MFQPFGFNHTSGRKGAITVTNAAHIVTNYVDCLHVPSLLDSLGDCSSTVTPTVHDSIVKRRLLSMEKSKKVLKHHQKRFDIVHIVESCQAFRDFKNTSWRSFYFFSRKHVKTSPRLITRGEREHAEHLRNSASQSSSSEATMRPRTSSDLTIHNIFMINISTTTATAINATNIIRIAVHHFILKPVSLAKFSRTLRQGLGETSNEALNARRCCVFKMVRGRLGPRRPSNFGCICLHTCKRREILERGEQRSQKSSLMNTRKLVAKSTSMSIDNAANNEAFAAIGQSYEQEVTNWIGPNRYYKQSLSTPTQTLAALAESAGNEHFMPNFIGLIWHTLCKSTSSLVEKNCSSIPTTYPQAVKSNSAAQPN